MIRLLERDELKIVQARLTALLIHPSVVKYHLTSMAACDAIVEKVLSLHGTMVLLHGFIKKTQKTPQGELELALKTAKKVMLEEK